MVAIGCNLYDFLPLPLLLLRVTENAGSPIHTPVGVEAETFVPMAKNITDEAFESKVKWQS